MPAGRSSSSSTITPTAASSSRPCCWTSASPSLKRPPARDALVRAWSKPYPHLVLIDLSLPDCHGTDVVRSLKQDPRTTDVPVVALSASVMAADKERAARPDAWSSSRNR